MKKWLFTSESVTEGHPDKICDQISDAVLDAIYEQDPRARVACETACTTGLVMIMGEITTDCYVDLTRIARNTIRDIGYTRAKYGFDAETCAVITSIDEQSSDIAMGVGNSLEARSLSQDEIDQIGAGDQGMVFGFACNETDTYMPLPIYLAHKAAKRLSEIRKSGALPYLRPDGKTQFTIRYEDNRPVAIDSILISSQHGENVSHEQLEHDIIELVAKPVIPEEFASPQIQYLVNPTGRFVIGGPQADTGLTGRKIIVDTYGGYARHGGGAFSGKDPTKVDRSGAYAARYAAKNIVAAGAADKCEIQIAYAIGRSHPVSIMVDTFGTNHVDNAKIEACVRELFDLRPAAIIETLGLRRPIYRATAAYGHFGRSDVTFPWEVLDKTAEIRSYLNL